MRQLIRDGDFVKFTMEFEKAGPVTFNIQPQDTTAALVPIEP
ncbi:hypothetical protein [Streptomyces griseomycini]|nr:hypothetical protein [Streptomyces griseomycini]